MIVNGPQPHQSVIVKAKIERRKVNEKLFEILFLKECYVPKLLTVYRRMNMISNQNQYLQGLRFCKVLEKTL